jgi:hypothetical protein
VVGSTRVTGLHASAEEVLNIFEDERRVVDGIDLNPEELFAHRPCQALA